MAHVTGLSALTAYGPGLAALRDGVASGVPAVAPVTRFDTRHHRAHHAATLPGNPDLFEALRGLIDEACDQAGLTVQERAGTPLVLALHAGRDTAAKAVALAAACGLRGVVAVHTAACAASNSALADAAELIADLAEERVVVAGGSFVDPSMFAAFDSAGILTAEGVSRPFSAGRSGPILGDGAAAAVLERADSRPGQPGPWLRVAGWGNTCEAHHVVRPREDGRGPAEAIAKALARAGGPRVGYVNAHATATPAFDAAEAAAILRGLPADSADVRVSSTKALHGHCLEGSGLVELAVCALAFREGRLPVNAGFTGFDDGCPLNLVLDSEQAPETGHMLSLNTGFGGVSTALVLAAP
ncbi:beta-ketoacyl synthase N-terminal-like domain-containing protein [Actinocorallia sp. A-T 12471]|uniref:beta-ketoacyl synthase N-terminal-like domain-containing protein n=1 Tax=Actinocorallia sp. A-T 12471 TaxID=3089813 RepID=UPI0029D1C19E|nr:beta-ketoacyl synthase N-terminal-like domain-containing protein [Actinocorallia sp. A-T 12471]MDX6744130.1 beta-ketoacyl synthase N-terminal-like domain-containing protein [Actinocorallia sp. A-T 12471]